MKKLIAVILAIALLLCGVNVCYADGDISYELTDGILVISGNGELNHVWTQDSSITQVIIEDGITSIPESAFYNCKKLTSVYIPDSVTYIGDYAFYMCTKLSDINLNDDITYIGKGCFCNDTKIKDINIPNSLTEICDDTFFLCSEITEIEIPETVTRIGVNAFRLTNISSLTIPESVKTIDTAAFCGCSKLTSVTLNEGLEDINLIAFDDCNNLAEITLPSTIKNLGNNFVKNTTSVNYNGTIEDFSNVNINDNVLDINYLELTNNNVYAEGNCNSNIDYSITNDGCLTLYGNGELDDYTYNNPSEFSQYKDIVNSVIISDEITYIGDYTFYGFDNLETVTLPESTIDIGNYSFYECINLNDINFNLINYAGDYAFYGCTNLNTGEDININCGASALEFEGDEQYTYLKSYARLDAIYDYLNYVYLNNDELAFSIDYITDNDSAIISALVDDITKDCATTFDKAETIWNWVDTHIAYGYQGYSSIDVLRYGNGLCSGQSQLMSAMLRLSGIRCAIIRGYKEDTTTTTLYDTYNNSAYNAHEWVLAYLDDDWYLLDSVWNMYGVTNDKETIAHWYFPVNVDGIAVYTSEGFDSTKGDSTICNTYYKNGNYIGYQYGEITSHCLANMQVGGCLSYDKHYDGNGYAISGGLNGSVYYYSTGIKKNGGVINNLLINEGGAIDKTNIIDNGFTNNALNVYIGEKLTLTDYSNLSVSNETVAEVNGNEITIIGEGLATIYSNNSGLITINCYGDIITSSKYFKEYCPHNHTHNVENITYCDCCGKVIDSIKNTEPEEPATDTNIEQDINEEEPISTPEPEAEVTIEETPIIEIITDTVEDIEDAVETVVDNIEDVVETIAEDVETVVEDITDIITDIFNKDDNTDDNTEQTSEEPEIKEEPIITMTTPNTTKEEPANTIIEKPIIVATAIDEKPTVNNTLAVIPNSGKPLENNITAEVIEEPIDDIITVEEPVIEENIIIDENSAIIEKDIEVIKSNNTIETVTNNIEVIDNTENTDNIETEDITEDITEEPIVVEENAHKTIIQQIKNIILNIFLLIKKLFK